jgi:hypothetical protein
MIREQDTWKFQADRIVRVVSEHRPELITTVGDYHPKDGIEFRITDATGKTLAETKSDYAVRPEYVAQIKTDEKFWEWLQRFAVSGRL